MTQGIGLHRPPMSPLVLLGCKGCGAPVDPGVRARVPGRLLIDLLCAHCGKRALYEVLGSTGAGD